MMGLLRRLPVAHSLLFTFCFAMALSQPSAGGRSLVELPGAAVAQAEIRPTALAAADFDGDGVPDLAVGYAGVATGAVVIHRGNVHALFPNAPEARQRRATRLLVESAFLPAPLTVDLPFAVDFLGAGDFDNDGRADLVAATSGGSSLRILKGDGTGGVSSVIELELGARLGTMVVGDVNRADGVPDLVVSTLGPDGPSLVVLENPGGLLRARAETIPVPILPISIVLARVGNDRLVSILAAAEDEILLVEGRDRRLLVAAPGKGEVAPASLQRLSLPSPIESMAYGDFLTETEPREELAVVTRAGKLLFFEFAQDGGAAVLKPVGSDELGAPGATLIPARISDCVQQDLLVLDAAGGPVRVLSGLRRGDSMSDVDGLFPAEIANLATWSYPEVVGRVRAVLPMRLNADARPDLVLLQEELAGPSLALTAPQSVITVNSNLDNVTAGNGLCTLREAITNANANSETTAGDCAAGAGLDTIAFAIGGGGSVTSISIGGSMLPIITNSVTIDGTTQGCAAPPCVEINGAPGGAATGLRLNGGAGGNTIRGLSINRFTPGHGIYGTTSGNIIEGNRIGTDVTGMIRQANGSAGIRFDGAAVTANTIGGTVAAARNLVSGNTGSGIVFVDGPHNNAVLGNHVGINSAGSSAIPNASGVYLGGVGTSSNTIGGTVPGAGNVASGNTNQGIVLYTSSSGNTVQGNLLGVDPTGSTALGNGQYGIWLSDLGSNILGGSAAGARNVVSGNEINGVTIDSDGNQVVGNWVGINATGTAAIPNKKRGLSLNYAEGNTIGPGNVVSGNQTIGDPSWGYGIILYSSSGNSIVGNFAGTDPSGTFAIGNARAGIILEASSSNIVGGTTPETRNVSSGNTRNGVTLTSSSNNNQVLGNYLGVDVTGTLAIPNGGDGAEIEDATGNTIGPANVISGNTEVGVFLESNAVGNTVRGNYVGTDATGTTVIGNGRNGVQVGCTPFPGTCGTGGATSNVIGGTTSEARNVIVGSGGDGVFLMNAADNNVVQGNSIGTDATGTLTLGNNGRGVRVLDSTGVRIGGSSAGEGNLIVNNGAAGVVVHGTSMDSPVLGNAIAGNALLGIDLGESDGVTPNDPADADTGPNGTQNFPVLTSVHSSPSGVVAVAGTLDSTPASSFRIEFFSSGSCDASGHGEGQRYLGFTDVITDGSGAAAFSASLTAPVQAGEAVAATATSATNCTSEFSACTVASCSGMAVFPHTLLAPDQDNLTWGSPADVRWVKGDLAALGSYSTLADGVLLAAPGLDISADQPPPQSGLYYLVRPLICGSWQTTIGGQPGRDSNLP